MADNLLPPEAPSPLADAPAPADPPITALAEPPSSARLDAPSPVPQHRRAGLLGGLRRDERGEGVISAAIAVLIMAFIGVAAFVAYRGIMSSVTEKTTECVDVYVSNGSGCD